MNKKTTSLIFFISCFIYNTSIFAETETLKITFSKKALQRLTTVITNLKKSYVKPLSDEKLYYDAIQGMLSNLDPHSLYFNGNISRKLGMTFNKGDVDGIGVEAIPEKETIKIIEVIENSPAEKAGIQVGDIIVKVNNKPIADMGDMYLYKAINILYSPKGSKVTLGITRGNDKPRIFTLICDTIKIPTVKWDLLAPNYGYIRIKLFTPNTATELKQAVADLKKATQNKLDGVIIDLRNNPGGSIEATVQTADSLLDTEHLKDNKLIVYTKDRDGNIKNYFKTTKDSPLSHIPLVVLINEKSGSGAEMLAAVLQDHKQAIIAGTRSYGKGSMQTKLVINDQRNANTIDLTTDLYYTTLGRSLQAIGVIPDIIINDVEISEKHSPKKIIREEDFVNHIPNGNGDKIAYQILENSKTQQNNELALAHKDYQLYEALHLLKVLNIANKQCATILLPNKN